MQQLSSNKSAKQRLGVNHVPLAVAVEAALRVASARGEGVFVVPQATSLRIALCAVREGDIPRLVEAFARPLVSS